MYDLKEAVIGRFENRVYNGKFNDYAIKLTLFV